LTDSRRIKRQHRGNINILFSNLEQKRMEPSGVLFAPTGSPTSSRFRISKNNARNSNIAAKQKAVYNWYESRNKDDDIDIYSPRWQQRLTQWDDWFGANNGAQEFDSSQEVKDDFDLRSFFFQDPIAAYSLWHVFQACFELDIAVCGPEASEDLKKWQELPPFIYLKSTKLRKRWEVALKKLNQQIQSEELEVEGWITRIYNIHRGISKLEDSMRTSHENFCADLQGTRLKESILQRVDEVFESRCNMITDILNAGDERQGTDGVTEDSKLDDGHLGEHSLSTRFRYAHIDGHLAATPESLHKRRVIRKKRRAKKSSS
jgi:hypothetical protein